MLRPLFAVLLAAAATPALAQVPPSAPDTSWADHMMDRPRQLGVEAELNALEARLRTEQNLADLRAQRPPPSMAQEATAAEFPTYPGRSQAWPTIPDAALAASRARVEAILAERR